ncbi:hypothetical protein Tco_0861624 [Tanacetum coccineum]|uniref:Uncharacterized protein n=1 Tax=Tanacetum coccineum TaxID=301880 RepID=A0ABQ5BKH7_9ASTR
MIVVGMKLELMYERWWCIWSSGGDMKGGGNRPWVIVVMDGGEDIASNLDISVSDHARTHRSQMAQLSYAVGGSSCVDIDRILLRVLSLILLRIAQDSDSGTSSGECALGDASSAFGLSQQRSHHQQLVT